MTDRMMAIVGTAAALWMLLQANRAGAGPVDTPLPTFSDNAAAVAVYTAVGVIKNNNLETDFFCTNLDSAPRDIGVEVFDETGARRNDFGPGNGEVLNVAPGVTVTFGTAATVVLHEDVTLTLNGAGSGANQLRNGSGRVVGTSRSISCTAVLVDKLHAIEDPGVSSKPPPTVASVPLIKVP